MLKSVALVASLFASTAANASIAHFSATGFLKSGYGGFAAGDPFSISVSYDDATPGFKYADNVYLFDSSTTSVDYSVNGVSGSDDVLYYDIVDDNTFNIEQVGDDVGPQADLVINLPSSYKVDGSLPTQAQLEASSGTANFLYFPDPNAGPFDAGGAGTIGVSSVPETGTWAMMILGFGVVGFGLRRARKYDNRIIAPVRAIATT